MNFKRKAYCALLDWKEKKNRKPLVIRGARQVGKSTLVKMFGKEFSNFFALNMEKKEDNQIFETLDSIDELVNAIYLLGKMPEHGEHILIFIDEIQESPEAIRQLRYFYEERPELYVIAAGSLLEFSLKDVQSFPVGRVEYLCMHPFNFEEFLMAIEHKNAIDAFNTLPVASFAHQTLLKLFHQYAIIGGMPEIVSLYVDDHNIAALSAAYDSIWQSYKDDVEKYARNNTDSKVLRHVMDTAPHETDRIKFERFGQSHYRSREVGEAIRSLDMAKIIQLIYPTTSLSPPVVTDFKKRPRLQFLDTGLINHALGLQGQMIGVGDLNDLYRGKIIQHLATQQLISIHEQPSYKPHFWVREKKDANAEVDLVYRHHEYVIPIEVKSGEQGKLRSLHQFVEHAGHPYAVRLSANHLAVEKVKTPGGTNYLLLNLPYYLAAKIPEYLEWFIHNHKL